ncbi:MAG TPA: DinB family protein [Actinomycetota bacterium]
MDAARRDELIARYREGSAVVEQVAAGLGDEDLNHVPADGGWSAREVIHHLADSEMTSAIRLRKLLAEDSPVIQGYDEEEFARRLHYDSRPPGPSLAALRATRESTATILDRLTEEDWGRSGTHTESGPYSVEMWLEIYASHAHDHAEQIERSVAEARGS